MTQPTFQIGQHTFKILYPELLRALTDAERQTLRDSIEKFGVLNPIAIDEENGVIDGANRLQLAVELGLLNVPVQPHTDLSPEEKVELALHLNEARRHLTPEDRQRAREKRVELVADLRRQGESHRSIAEQTGVSEKQIREDLKKANAEGYAVEPESGRVMGKDGKTRPATKKKTEPTTESKETTGKPESDEEPLLVVPVGVQEELFNEESQAPKAVDPADEEDAEPEPAPAATPVPRPAPKHPHSDLLNHWLDLVAGTPHLINTERGGIESMLAESDKWDWNEVRHRVLPLLVALSKTITEYKEAIAIAEWRTRPSTADQPAK
jgi:hypothetical protein